MDLPVNLKKLRQKAADMRRALADLSPYAEMAVDQYLKDRDRVAASKYYLLVATEAAIDICNHLAARLAKQAPDSYAECFEILAQKNIISAPLAERLVRMARFRNLLIHQYGDVDDRKVHEIICYNLDDLDLYLTEIAALLKADLP
ncbi:DUF86 domain-containing protein [Desulfofundulus thermobenzoicus]|uniref:DUF86 domain-containing protein n=1 Tax=Desulfofundulus thermobenzoicus TaxID=29376 RepID=A0A6N7IT38_9FIRM|nr:DUF86 domain-containing protein [Desulfofundulus thermobenzoicus]